MQGGEGGGSPGEAAPRPGYSHGAVPPLRLLSLSGLRTRLLMGDKGCWRRRFIQRSVFPWPEPAGFHICTDVLSSPHLRKQRRAVRSQLPLAPAAAGTRAHRREQRGHEPKSLALTSAPSPAGCHRRCGCPGWQVTLVWLKAEPRPRGDKVLPTVPALRRVRGNSSRSRAASSSSSLCVCMYVFIYFTYIKYIFFLPETSRSRATALQLRLQQNTSVGHRAAAWRCSVRWEPNWPQ